jgi:hypothetical protein
VEESACLKKGEDRRNAKKQTKMCKSKLREKEIKQKGMYR